MSAGENLVWVVTAIDRVNPDVHEPDTCPEEVES